MKIDFSKLRAQEYIESIVALVASWGVNYIRQDGVGPGSSAQPIDNSQDVMAWKMAIAKSGRPFG